MLPQQPVVFPGSIKENLLIGLKFSGKPEVGDDKLTQVLEMVSLKRNLMIMQKTFWWRKAKNGSWKNYFNETRGVFA